MKLMLLLLLISLGSAAIFTTTALVEVGDGKHSRSNYMRKALGAKNNKEKKMVNTADIIEEKNAKHFINPTSKFVYDDSKKENKDMNKGVGDKYYSVSNDDDAYPSANGASIDTHHMISIDQYKRIISDRPFHP